MEQPPLVLSTSSGPVVRPNDGSITFIGTATVLIRYAGFTILTDPNFLHAGQRIHLGYGLHATRLTDPAIEIDQLPPLDLVVLSHMHEDHFDRVAADKLDKSTAILTTGQAASVLKRRGFTAAHPMRTWQSREVVKGSRRLRISSMPGRHGPRLIAPLMPPVMGSMLEFQPGPGAFRIYISGDTLIGDPRLADIPLKYPEIDLALLHLGGTRIFGILVTMDGRQGVQAMRLLRPRRSIPIHYNDYDVFHSSLDDFRNAVVLAGLESKVRYLSHGQTYRFHFAPRAIETRA